MLQLNHISLGSFAFRCGASYIGGKPFISVNPATLGKLYFLFNQNHFGNYFFQFIRQNFDSNLYVEEDLFYHGKQYLSISLQVPQTVNSKFLLSFKQFSKHQYLISY